MHKQKSTTELGRSHRHAYKSLSVHGEGRSPNGLDGVSGIGGSVCRGARLFRQEEWRQARAWVYSQHEVFTLWPGAAPSSTLVFRTMCSFYDSCPSVLTEGFCFLLFFCTFRFKPCQVVRLLGVCLYCIIWVNKRLRVSKGAIICRSLSTLEEPSRNISLWLILHSSILAFFFNLDNRDNYTYQI